VKGGELFAALFMPRLIILNEGKRYNLAFKSKDEAGKKSSPTHIASAAPLKITLSDFTKADKKLNRRECLPVSVRAASKLTGSVRKAACG
jgi:hypothetical protein